MTSKRVLHLVIAAALVAISARLPARDLQSVTRALPAALFLQGTIRDQVGVPVAGARVDVRDPATGEILADTRSDATGQFAFLDLAVDTRDYVLHASKSGYGVAEKKFEVAQAVTKLKVELTLGVAERPRGRAQRFATVRVLYATDRKARVDSTGVAYLPSKGPLAFGSCEVTIPETHALATIERPSIWKFELRADPERHIVLQKVSPEPESRFFEEVSRLAGSSPEKEAFVFIHGYNVSFEDAALRTAQLAYDLHFQGAPIFYSWPSTASLFGYGADERAVEQTVTDLSQFLRKVASSARVATVHLIAHSMGNRALLPALARLDRESIQRTGTTFREIVLAAPDIDADVFEKLATEIRRPTRHVTLYVSSRDQALHAATFLFNKPPRAGQAGEHALVLPGVDTVDVSRVSIDALGHSYYGDNPDVVADLEKIFRSQHPPRQGLVKAVAGQLTYWLLQPTAVK